MSEKALVYSEEQLKHRFLIIYEAVGLGETASYFIRSLLSEGCIRYETVEKTEGGLRPRKILREGPTGAVLTTTEINLHPENETRLLSIPVSDTPEQTRAVMLAIAKDAAAGTVDESWLALQTWLEQAEHRVTIPYAEALANSIPPNAVRLRRDFGSLLSLIKASAILHQVNRGRDATGRIVAAIDDFAIVHELVADLFAEGIEASVPRTVRETVEAVAELKRQGARCPTVTQVASILGIDKSAASRRVREAIERRYLVNLEEKSGLPAKLELGESLPEECELLPPPDDERLRAVSDKTHPSNQSLGIQATTEPTDMWADGLEVLSEQTDAADSEASEEGANQ